MLATTRLDFTRRLGLGLRSPAGCYYLLRARSGGRSSQEPLRRRPSCLADVESPRRQSAPAPVKGTARNAYQRMKISIGKPPAYTSQALPSSVETAWRPLQTDDCLTQRSLSAALKAFESSDARLDSNIDIADVLFGNDIIADGSDIVRVVFDGLTRRLDHPVFPDEKVYLIG
jgi:hypothetical protein